MTSILDPASAPSSLLERLQQHEKLLGVMVDGQAASPAAASELDFVVVGANKAVMTAALAASSLPVVLMVQSGAELEAARAAGVRLTIARDGGVPGADITLSDDGPARLVTSTGAARAAFASGAQVVVYDAVAMIEELMATLPAGRPDRDVPAARQPLVLLSGMLGDHHVWDDLAAGLGDAALPWPARIDLDDSVAEMALSVLAEAPPSFALAGHSLGAIVALEIVRRAPERVTRLALLNASARGPVQPQLDAWAESRRRTEAGEFDEVARELAHTTLPPAHRQPPLVARNEAMARAIGPEGFVRQLAAQATRPDSRASLGSIEVPVLVLSGEFDEVCPPALQRELAELCPQARLETVADAGHMAPLEQPERVAALLADWLTEDGRAQ